MAEQRKQFKFDPNNLAKLEAFIKANHRVKIGVLGSSEERPAKPPKPEKDTESEKKTKIRKKCKRRKTYKKSFGTSLGQALHKGGRIFRRMKRKLKKKAAPIDAVALAAVHEFGSVKRSIPSRSFLRSTMANSQDRFKLEVETNKEKMFETICSGQWQKFMNQIGGTWVRYVHDTFENHGGGSWAAVKEPYASRKVTDKILQETGAMLRSITHEVEK